MPKNIDDIVFLVQSRINSSRLPRKVVKNFADSSLFEIALNKFINCKHVPASNILASVRDKELIEISKRLNVKIHKRSEISALKEEKLQEIFDWYNKIDYKYYVIVAATSPCLRQKTVDDFVENYINSESDGMFGVYRKNTLAWDSDKNLITRFPGSELNTKKTESILFPGHCLYAGRIDKIAEGIHMGSFKNPQDPDLFIIDDEKECFDIDYEWQFIAAEALYRSMNEVWGLL